MNKEEKFARFRAQAQQHLDQIEAQRVKTALSAFLSDRVRPFMDLCFEVEYMPPCISRRMLRERLEIQRPTDAAGGVNIYAYSWIIDSLSLTLSL